MRKLKSILHLSLIGLCVVSLLQAGTIILNFHGQPGFNQVTLKWTTQNEVNLKGFEVQRSLDQSNENSFQRVDFVKASTEVKDQKEYTFEDKSVFKQIPRTFYYRLKIVDNNESFSHSKVITVTPTISSARQTWGSIKAMFR